MNNKIFFSIVIPTFNRAEYLERAIACILIQNFKNFELIICDNDSLDNTKEVVSSFKDKRIKYFRNKTNIGWIRNLKKGISIAKGEYIILHGDDDFMLFPTALSEVYKVILKKKCGFIRINYLNFLADKNFVFDFRKPAKKDIEIKSGAEKKQVVDFITRVDPFFVTGIVFKNNLPRRIGIIDSEFVAWFKIIFHTIQKEGGYFIFKHLFVASWSQNASHPRYYLNKGRFRFEQFFDEVKKELSKKDYSLFLKKRLGIVIKEFPAAKYYTSNSNLLKFSKRVLELQPEFKYSFDFWFWLLLSIFIPKPILSYIRKNIFLKMVANTNIPNYDRIHKRIIAVNNHTNG
jgi:glycosyltransferase involved in cell wall biosynthesis